MALTMSRFCLGWFRPLKLPVAEVGTGDELGKAVCPLCPPLLLVAVPSAGL